MINTGRSLFRLQDSGASIPREHRLMGEHFREAGYETFGTGKWHNGTDSYARSFSAGAEIFFGGMDDHWNVPACDFAADGKYPEARAHPWDPGTGTVEMREKPFDHVATGVHSSELFARATREFLLSRAQAGRSNSGREFAGAPAPFLAYVSFMAPHDPRTMPQRFLNMYKPAEIRLPANFREAHPFDNGELEVRDELLAARPRHPDEIRRHIAEYYAMISHLDEQIGVVIDTLKATGELDNTIVVLAGDNGLALGQHGLMGKQSTYNHSVRVPLLLAGPGIPTAETRESFCYLQDIFPTLCDLAGLDIPQSVDARSLLPALHDPEAHVREELYLAYKDLHRAVHDGRYKLVEYDVEGTRHSRLFDEIRDPLEQCNLAEDSAYAETLHRLRTRLSALRGEYRDPIPAFWEA
jgi:arylsulfatase A-like enzyme